MELLKGDILNVEFVDEDFACTSFKKVECVVYSIKNRKVKLQYKNGGFGYLGGKEFEFIRNVNVDNGVIKLPEFGYIKARGVWMLKLDTMRVPSGLEHIFTPYKLTINGITKEFSENEGDKLKLWVELIKREMKR